MRSEADISIRRRPWPGHFSETTNSETYIYQAIDPLIDTWRWDDLNFRNDILRVMNKDQLALWAIWNIDGEIENGGIAQAISNSSGELCEDAVIGFRHFELHHYADRLGKTLSCYERPISLIRDERYVMLEKAVGLSDQRSDRFSDNIYISELFERCSRRSGDVEASYWKLKASEPPMLEVLGRIVDTRRAAFFDGV